MRWLGLGLVVVLLLVTAVAVLRPELVPGQVDIPRISYLLLWLLLVAGAGAGFLTTNKRMAWLGLLIWPALILALVWGYNAFS